MAFKNYEMVLSSTWSKPRAIDAIIDDFQNPSGTDMDHRVAEIELRIAEGDNLARGRKYDGALKKYKTARGLIYKILYPGFNVSSYANQRLDLMLPLNAQIEASLLEATVSIADINRPKTVPASPTVGVKVPQIARDVATYTQDGYREIVSSEAAIQQASEQAVALLGEGKASAATQTPGIDVGPNRRAARRPEHAGRTDAQPGGGPAPGRPGRGGGEKRRPRAAWIPGREGWRGRSPGHAHGRAEPTCPGE